VGLFQVGKTTPALAIAEDRLSIDFDLEFQSALWKSKAVTSMLEECATSPL
jgi:hypothetical protein